MKNNTRRYFYRCIFGTFLLTVMSGCTPPAEKVDPLDILFPHEWVGNIDKIDFNEPSGIVYHSQRSTLFVVGDQGDICEIKKDGTLVKQKHIRDADFEGITVAPSTGLLYIAIEGEEKIIELDPEDFRVLREFTIERTFQEKIVLKAGGQGIEAITFIPDSNHPEGGTFYVANQCFTLDDEQDLSAIFEIEVPLRTGSGSDTIVKITRFFSLGVIDLSGLYYDEMNNRLYVVSDAMNSFFEVTKAGKILKSYALPGESQEGIAVDDEDYIYIAQDSGGIIKRRWLR